MNLEPMRQRIDEIDEALVRLLNDRARVAVEIGDEKRRHEAPAHDPEREDRVLDRVAACNAGPLPDAAIRSLYSEIIRTCRSLEERPS